MNLFMNFTNVMSIFEITKMFALLTVQTLLGLTAFAEVDKTVGVKVRNSSIGVIQCFVCVM